MSNQFPSAEWAPFADLTQHKVSPSGQTLLHQAAQNEQRALEAQHWLSALWQNRINLGHSGEVCTIQTMALDLSYPSHRFWPVAAPMEYFSVPKFDPY